MGHGASKLFIDLLQRGYVIHGPVEEIFGDSVVTDVRNVIASFKDTTAEIVDAVNACYAGALDASKEVFESQQVPRKARNWGKR